MSTQIGPFWSANRKFVIESLEEGLLDDLAQRLCDLRNEPVWVDATDRVDEEITVFRIERNGPTWMSHPWGLWRDDEPCETTVTNDYVIPYVLWEVTRLALEGAQMPVVPMHAASLVHRGHAIALTGPSHSGKSTLAAWLTRSGWGFLTDEVSLLDTSVADRPIVNPFWRPIGVRRPGPLDDVVELPSDASEVLLPASSIGELASPAPLVALVCPTYSEGASSSLEPLGAAAALTLVADQLPSLGRDGGPVFHALADVVSVIPAFQMLVDDLDTAERELASLVDRLIDERAEAGEQLLGSESNR
ncbi:hypothetical protein [Ilumatobacter sp.]|uniref:hypothetical protein n=1 Tax=Ilumatobacter sp. TaxID=1967498 RepID=UPI003C59B25C